MEFKVSFSKRPTSALKSWRPWGDVYLRPDRQHAAFACGWWLLEFYVGLWEEE